MQWNKDDLIGCRFTFWVYLSGMKNICVLKRILNMKTSFTHGLGKPASLGTLPPHKQSLRKPLPLLCIHSACWYSTGSNNTPGIHIKVNARLLLLCSFPFLSFKKRRYCKLNGSLSYVSMPFLRVSRSTQIISCLTWSESLNFNTTRISVGLLEAPRSTRFAASSPQSTSLQYNMNHGLRSTVYSL